MGRVVGGIAAVVVIIVLGLIITGNSGVIFGVLIGFILGVVATISIIITVGKQTGIGQNLLSAMTSTRNRSDSDY